MKLERGAQLRAARSSEGFGEVAKWLRQRFAKPSGPKGSRGFESHPLRTARPDVLRAAIRMLDRCPRGLRSTIGNRVGVTPSWVRIPPCP
jgi:hypothetical protein